VRQVNSEIVELIGLAPAVGNRPASGKGIRGLFVRMRDRLHLNREPALEKKSEKPEHAEATTPLLELYHGENEIPSAPAPAGLSQDQPSVSEEPLVVEAVPVPTNESPRLNGSAPQSKSTRELPSEPAIDSGYEKKPEPS
jgi:hypothetical protein